MCGQYSLFMPWSEVRELMVAAGYGNTGTQPNLRPRYNIRPGEHEGALVALIRDGQVVVERLKWGFRAKADSNLRPPNAVGETLFQKWPWKTAAMHRRCAVVMDGFYEPRGPKRSRAEPPRPQFYFRRIDRRPFLVAGVWTHAVDDNGLDTFALVTTTPNATVAPIHGRMPALLDAANLDTWLGETRDVAALQALLAPWQGEPLETWQVNASKISAREYDAPDCIEPSGDDRDEDDQYKLFA